ncbi:Sortilin, neurotensin receptor 3 [Aquiflexum balticum DSM 16537]|uniref:Sortilin, neurotensin receptor 3 n=1 Tax=Aquiflexum balticum DSM 16537 TaxID=758820 RepID=A0A1W2H196_9BACT|nr:sialidase family protein [Aquiflexum balticum]SMD42266.1 Sortilin, neurotensin receptor 3 [Aquiflexum balticum DSM 16537]
MRKAIYLLFTTLLLISFTGYSSWAQSNQKDIAAHIARGLQVRSIGPAVMGGRIADIAINPIHGSTWYVAVGSGGLWKTTNSGTTWTPVFDAQASYSIGTVALDPRNPEVVWVGTGENVSGRHVGWGDGVYKSMDGGATWQQMGLKNSEHIGRILIDPRNSEVVYVAAEGPLWSSGGERGLYKTKDGGKTWQLALEIDADTGVTDAEFDPSNPDVIYAAAYQRRRKTWALLGGGPKSGIYKSMDGGESWRRINVGLPQGDMGKIGLAVTPADPQIVYATIEADNANKGFYRSTDKGESWEKRNSYISGGTGPHYYQEIEASPTNPDLVYQMDVFINVTRDGGKTFDYSETGRTKHSDNHALWINPANGQHLIVGTDGGLYESFDEGATWRHFPNLPVSQFYKVGLDNAEPFYNVVVGAQDLGTLLGPSRTTNVEGVRNQDWYVPLGADGYDVAFDPKDPNIVYMEIQQGELHRHNRTTREILNIQPQPEPNYPPERWNWDSPIQVSPHDHKTLYFGSQRVWKSTDRGNSWKAISADLTTNLGRYELEMMGRVPSIDALYDNGAMSKFATLTTLSESTLQAGLLYTGSDDGLIHVTEDDGQNWRKGGSLPKVPALTFINNIEASSHDVNTVFAAADAHQLGDYSSYVFISTDKGKTWRSIAGDLPVNTLVWVIKQDHIDENLLFIGTEYGIYFSVNKGVNWTKLNAGVPTIPFRDLALHARDNDLVGASFGRGIYILDDYSPLREINKLANANSNVVLPVRDAWWYVPNEPMQAKGMPSQGSTSFVSDNPPFGAVFTYFINNLPKTEKAVRKESEKKLNDQKASIPFPGWDQLRGESIEEEPSVMLLVRDKNGEAIRWIEGVAKTGLHRASWDLRLPPPDPIELTVPAFQPPWVSDPQGPLVAPGKYSVELYVIKNGKLELHGDAQEFMVKPVHQKSDDYEAMAAFKKQTSDLSRRTSSAASQLGEAGEKLRYIKAALTKTPNASPDLFAQLTALNASLFNLRTVLLGDAVLQRKDESTSPSIMSRVGVVIYGHWNTTEPPTATHKRNIEIAQAEFDQYLKDASAFYNELADFELKLERAGAPYTPNRKMD